VAELYSQLLLGGKALWTPLRLLSSYLPRLNQKMILELILQDLSKKYLSTTLGKEHDPERVNDSKEAVGGVSAIVAGYVGDDEYLKAQLIAWLTTTLGPYTAQNLETRRAMILVFSGKEGKFLCEIYISWSDVSSEKLRMLLERSMQVFSDKLHIKHDSILQQEG
jgi:hypothetical protein